MEQRTDELLKALAEAGVEFVVVGGVAANLHGSSQTTRDFDVLAPLTADNCRKILAALSPFSPRFYQTLGKPPVDRSAEQLAQFKNLYFLTDLGIIDLLGTLPPVGDYQTVASRAVSITLFGIECRVLSLDDLIAVKHHVGRPKDRSVEIELRAIRDRIKKP